MLRDLESELDDVLLGETNRRTERYIRWVQLSLNRLIGAGLVVDGIAGRRTRQAVRRFQRHQGLKADGVVGRRTERALIGAGASPHPSVTPRPSAVSPTPSVTGGAPPSTTPLERIANPSQVPVLLSQSEATNAARKNEEQGRRLGWAVLFDAIAGWILKFRDMTPGPVLFTQAVANWQPANNIPITGVLDYDTWLKMLREAKRGIPSVYRTPDGVDRPRGLGAIVATFGNPTKRGWEAQNIVRIYAPAGRTFRRGVTRLRVHRLLAPQFNRLFAAIEREGLWNEVSPTSGTYYCRTKSTSSVGKQKCGTPGIRFDQLSTHSWGITIDMRANSYPFYKRGMFNARRPLKYPPPPITCIFQDHGFHWGLWFMNGKLRNGRINFVGADPHHFQFATGY